MHERGSHAGVRWPVLACSRRVFAARGLQRGLCGSSRCGWRSHSNRTCSCACQAACWLLPLLTCAWCDCCLQEQLQAALQAQLDAAGVQDAASWLQQQPGQQEQQQQREAAPHPRTARVNTLKASVTDVLQQLAAAPARGKRDGSGGAGAGAAAAAVQQVAVDELLPDLLVFPPGTDLHDHPLVESGVLVLQVRRRHEKQQPWGTRSSSNDEAPAACMGSSNKHDVRCRHCCLATRPATCRARRAACRRMRWRRRQAGRCSTAARRPATRRRTSQRCCTRPAVQRQAAAAAVLAKSGKQVRCAAEATDARCCRRCCTSQSARCRIHSRRRSSSSAAAAAARPGV